MQNLYLNINFIVLCSKLCFVSCTSLSEKGLYTTTRYQSKLRAEMAQRFNSSEDLMSAFSSWNIMKTQFRSGKVLLPVLNTPRSSYNHRWPVLEPKRPVKTERRIYVKREESYHIPSEKNHYLAHLMDIGQKPIQPNSFKNVIQQFGKAFVQMPPL